MPMRRSKAVSFIIYKDEKILVEKRRLDEPNDPGEVLLPSEHVKYREKFKPACKRGLWEELGLDCGKFRYIATLKHRSEKELLSIRFYSCEGYTGTPTAKEAESIFWIGLGELDVLDDDIDRIAIKKYLQGRAQYGRKGI